MTIKKLCLSNFRRFAGLELDCDHKRNVLVGDNESGKSTVLLAVDLVLSGSRSKVETAGLESLFNASVVSDFLEGDRSLSELPTLVAEIYLSEQGNPHLNGRNNSRQLLCDGLRLCCEPIDEYSDEISKILGEDGPNFPFEFYSIHFRTFAGEPYSGFRRPIKHLVIDSSQINNEYATREYTRSMYAANAEALERNRNENRYRKSKAEFETKALKGVNSRLGSYRFAVKTNARSNLESDLVIKEDDLPIGSKGKGRQCFVKTEFALQKHRTEAELDVLLLEEPENHLSHTSMRKLIRRISDSVEKQLFIATHNSLVCSRLDLRNAILLSTSATRPIRLDDLPEDTAKFFMKAPDNNVLEFVLSRKVILVEGDAEFILLDSMYKKSTPNSTLEDDGVHVISVGGTSFRRYLDLAKLLGTKTAVIRDNDGNVQANCVDRYSEYSNEHIKVFADRDNTRSTFEVCMYQDNRLACEKLFSAGRRTLSVQDYMLANKTDAAFELLDKKKGQLITPPYIDEAIEWIKK